MTHRLNRQGYLAMAELAEREQALDFVEASVNYLVDTGAKPVTYIVQCAFGDVEGEGEYACDGLFTRWKFDNLLVSAGEVHAPLALTLSVGYTLGRGGR